jgi:hypothetical protein
MTDQLAPIHPSEVVAFDMYFGSIVSMNNHPGKNREGGQKLSLEGCAATAIAMLQIRRTLIPTEFSHE